MPPDGYPTDDSPKVSICVPSFNHSRFLRDCISSLLNQSYSNLEIIVRDDHSEDNSWDYLQTLSDPRVRVFRNSERLGITRNWNAAVNDSSGDLVVIVPSDDMLCEGHISKLVSVMVAHPEIGFVGVGVEYIRPGGEVLGEKLRRGLGDGEIDIRGGQARIFSYLFANKITFSGTMFRRDVYNKVGGFDESMTILEDRDFWVRCLRVSREGFLNEKLVRFRWHESNMSGLAVHKPRVYSEEAQMIKKAGRGMPNIAIRLLLPLPISYVFFKLLRDPSLSHFARRQIFLQLIGDFVG